MRLDQVVLTNFRQHASSRIVFDLGLTGIIGPNGSGKTTILEAIAFALYGARALRLTKETVRFLRAGPRAPVRVELDFELSGHRYRVVRELNSAEVYLDGADTCVVAGTESVNEFLLRRLGMTREEFHRTYFTGQKELGVMTQLQPAQRAQFLARVLGHDRLQAAQERAREERNRLREKMDFLQRTLPDPGRLAQRLEEAQKQYRLAVDRVAAATSEHLAAEAALGELRPRWEQAQRSREEARRVESELRVARNEEASLANQTARLAQELNDLASAREELERLRTELQSLSTIQQQLDTMEGLAREEGRRQALTRALESLATELNELRERREQLAAAAARVPQLRQAVASTRESLDSESAALEQRRTDWVRDRQEAETKRDQLRRQYVELKEQYDKLLRLGEESPCPVCTRPLGSSYRTVVSSIKDQMDTLAVDGRYYASRVEQLQNPPADLQALEVARKSLETQLQAQQRELVQAEAAAAQLVAVEEEEQAKAKAFEDVRRELAGIPSGYDPGLHQQLRRERDRLAAIEQRATKLGATLEREPRLKEERDRLEADLVAVRRRIADLEAECARLGISEAELEDLRRRYESAQAKAREAEVALTAAKGQQSAARLELEHAESMKRSWEEAQTQLAALEKERRLNDELVRAFADIRNDLNARLRPELSELASRFLRDLTDGRYSELELTESFDVVVMEGAVPKQVLSGGEEDLAQLSLRLAISQLIAERAGQDFSLLVLDEIFGSLDDIRRHNVVELLRGLTDRFEQVILITHIESVRDRLDRVIELAYDEETGATRIESASTPPLAGSSDMYPLEAVAEG